MLFRSQFIEIKNFCKKKNIKFYILDNYKLAIKHNLDGIILSHNNRTYSHIKLVSKKNFTFVGKAHNQNNYYVKSHQRCSKIILSPIFKNDKYNYNELLGISKFNLISKNWNKEIYALGGINIKNLKKINMTRSKGLGFSSSIFKLKIKKPVLYSRTGFL